MLAFWVVVSGADSTWAAGARQIAGTFGGHRIEAPRDRTSPSSAKRAVIALTATANATDPLTVTRRLGR
jgi:hypothetical protein